MARVTPEEFQEKQARRLKAAAPDIRRGIERVTKAPTLLAAAKKDKMRAKLVESIDNGKWEAGLKRVSLEDWKKATIDKGINRIAAGIDGAKQKVINFAEQLLPYVDKEVEKVKNMPDVTLEDSIARMTSFVRGMSEFKRTR